MIIMTGGSGKMGRTIVRRLVWTLVAVVLTATVAEAAPANYLGGAICWATSTPWLNG
jgi:NAD(P)-dependent dehydrogenase (short-subunit alcohol dehydrogenase family)